MQTCLLRNRIQAIKMSGASSLKSMGLHSLGLEKLDLKPIRSEVIMGWRSAQFFFTFSTSLLALHLYVEAFLPKKLFKLFKMKQIEDIYIAVVSTEKVYIGNN